MILDQSEAEGEIDISTVTTGVYLLMIEYGEERSFHRVVKL